MGKFCPHHHRSLVTLRWMLQMSSYLLTLFLLTFFRSRWGLFSKKKFEKFEKLKEKFLVPTPKGPPFWRKNFKKIKKSYLFLKNHAFSTWIWILHVLSFILMYITYILLKIFNFPIFAIRFRSMTNFIPFPLTAKKNHQKRFILVSMDW